MCSLFALEFVWSLEMNKQFIPHCLDIWLLSMLMWFKFDDICKSDSSSLSNGAATTKIFRKKIKLYIRMHWIFINRCTLPLAAMYCPMFILMRGQSLRNLADFFMKKSGIFQCLKAFNLMHPILPHRIIKMINKLNSTYTILAVLRPQKTVG